MLFHPFLLILMTSLTLIGCSRPAPEQATEDHQPVTLKNTEVRNLHSSIVDADFEISVALPESYSTSSSEYPAFYVTDSNFWYALVTQTNFLLRLNQEIPEMIVVGIGYPSENLMDLTGWRRRDFTPTRDPEQEAIWKESIPGITEFQSGGAPAFLQFIRDELKPFIASNYRVAESDSALMGDSLGGLFAFYVLFHQPDTFQRYLIGSPFLDYDDSVTFRFEEKLAAEHEDLPAKVFMAAGGLEGDELLSSMKEMETLLRSRQYPGLSLETVVFEGENHFSVIPATTSRGLRTLFGQ
jgi:predicted alpha/beta superfamily hydrolase